MSETTMLSYLLHCGLMCTFDRRSDDTLRLSVWDPRLDTTTVYTCSRAQGASWLIASAYTYAVAEYGPRGRS